VSVEFGGPGLADLNIDERRTLSTMGAELSADFTIFEGDGRLTNYMRERGHGSLECANPDSDASYQDVRHIDLSAIEPQIAYPDSIINNTTAIQSAVGKKITRAFIGSCANGNLSDLASAANVIRGHRIADGVQLIITPASQEIYRQALKAGYIEAFIDAGAIVTNATCGACGGGHMGVLGPNEVCITASTRNFKGRMGHPSAQIYMASPATVAASAVRGVISEPWEQR
jgi:3-isopropylmalate/(R)-2-methylmalate dehydratase large subunit